MIVITTLSLIFIYLLCPVTGFSWKNCDNPDNYAQTDVLTVEPSPIRFGENISLDAFFTAKKQIPVDSVIGLEIWRHFSILGMLPLDVRMPCVFGNDCKANLCGLVSRWPLACQIVKRSRNSDSCECPIEAGIYGHKNLIRQIPDAIGILKVFGAGTYLARVRLVDPNLDQEIACILITESVY